LECWRVFLCNIFKIGNRICQSHCSEESVKTEDIIDIKSNRIAKVNKNVHTSSVVYNYIISFTNSFLLVKQYFVFLTQQFNNIQQNFFKKNFIEIFTHF